MGHLRPRGPLKAKNFLQVEEMWQKGKSESLGQALGVPAGSGPGGLCARTRKRPLGAVGGAPADSQKGNRGLIPTTAGTVFG